MKLGIVRKRSRDSNSKQSIYLYRLLGIARDGWDDSDVKIK